MPGWGSTAEHTLPDETAGTSYGMVTDPEIVFVANEDSRNFCHAVSEGDALKRRKIRIVSKATDQELKDLIRMARIVVIATSRQSVFADSPVQRRERIAAILAHAQSKKLVLFASSDHESVQEHLSLVRKKAVLVVTPMRHGISEGYRDNFSMQTSFISRIDDVPDFYHYLADQLCTLL